MASGATEEKSAWSLVSAARAAPQEIRTARVADSQTGTSLFIAKTSFARKKS